MTPDTLPEFRAGVVDEADVSLPHARMRRLVAQVLTDGGLPGITVAKIGEQLPSSSANDYSGGEHVQTAVASDEVGAAYRTALERGYAKLRDLEQEDLRIFGPGGTVNNTYLDFPARGGLREAKVAEHLATVIVPQLAARGRHSSTH